MLPDLRHAAVPCQRDCMPCHARGQHLYATPHQVLARLLHAQGLPVNMGLASDVAALADFAAEQLGSVDIWINNAGEEAAAGGI
jgi:NAD(P)-dependent dehydrogenase (short-subunit alcohol dehydrogenase family)